MASLALMALGTSMGWGQTALTIAGLAGSYLDQAYIMPALFPTEQQKYSTGKLDDLQLQSASEGKPINRCYGEAVPCYGEVIWLPEMIEVVNTEEEGGKGGGGGTEYTTYTYYQDVAIGVCAGTKEISHIWADSKLIYLNASFDTEVFVGYLVGEINVIRTRHSSERYNTMELIFDNDGILPNLEVGRGIGLNGFTGIYSVNGGYYNLQSMELNDAGMVVLLIDNPDVIEQTLTESGQKSITQSLITTSGQYDSLTIYGGVNNLADPTMESYKGVGNIPCYKGLCYVVFHRLKLADYGNRLPNLKFLVRDLIGLPT